MKKVKVPVYIITTASAWIGKVEIEKPEDFEEAAQKLWESKGWEAPTLCCQCGDVDLGDFEVDESLTDFYFKDVERTP